MAPKAERLEAWQRLATDLEIGKLENLITDVPFDEVIVQAPKMMQGQIRGRIVVPVAGE